MERNQPPPGRMVHSVMSLMRDRVDEKLRGKSLNISIRFFNFLDIIDLEEVLFSTERKFRFGQLLLAGGPSILN